MTAPPHLRCRRGLTLIELVLTLSILAVAGAIVAGALTTSLRAWQTGFRHGREDLVARIVLERIGAQLRAAVFSPTRREGNDAVAFDAKEGTLRFVTLGAGGAAPTQVSYSLESDAEGPRLVYREYPWPDKDFFKERPPRREEQLPEVVGFAVKAAPHTEDEAGMPVPPGGEWSPLDIALPSSVSIELTLREAGGDGNGEPKPYRIVVTLPTEVQP